MQPARLRLPPAFQTPGVTLPPVFRGTLMLFSSRLELALTGQPSWLPEGALASPRVAAPAHQASERGRFKSALTGRRCHLSASAVHHHRLAKVSHRFSSSPRKSHLHRTKSRERTAGAPPPTVCGNQDSLPTNHQENLRYWPQLTPGHHGYRARSAPGFPRGRLKLAKLM